MFTNKPVDYNHIYLYAKSHYRQSDNVVRDVAIILAERSAMDVEYYERDPLSNIVQHLLPLAYDAITRTANPPYFFQEFIANISPEGNWKCGGPLTHNIFGKPIVGRVPEDYATRVLRAILSILSGVRVIGENGETLIELGEADRTILPLTHEPSGVLP